MGTDIVIGIFGLAGVVLGAVVSNVLTRRGETDRLAAEDARRWLNERRSIYARYLALCDDMLRQIDRVGCFLSYDGAAPISEEDEEIIEEGLLEFHVRWDDELQPLLSDVQLMATPTVSDLADRTAFSLMELTAPVELRSPFTEYYPVWFQARDLFQVLRNAMRNELGLAPIEEGPIRDPDWPWLVDRPSRESYVQAHPRQRRKD